MNVPNSFLLQSGKVDFIQIMGITLAESEMAKQTSSQALALKLIDITGGLITDTVRSCII